MIRITNVNKSYDSGAMVLRNINLTVERGEIVAILGSSGAGKSSLLRCMNGLVEFAGGSIHIDGLPVGKKRKELRHIHTRVGMIFQQFNLVKRITVLENVLCGSLARNHVLPSIFKFYYKADIELAVSCLERVGMKEHMHNRADRLSGGQQQRVAIARTLIQQPTVLLADEPVASLDPNSSAQVMGILRELNKQDGITVVVNLHDIHLARTYADRIVGINRGQIVVDKLSKLFNETDLKRIYEDEVPAVDSFDMDNMKEAAVL